MTPIPDDDLRAALDETRVGWASRDGLRDAAVLVPWFTRGGADWLLFTERRDDLPAHAGEVSFPGGARDGDEDALTCALRETREEVGLDPDRLSVLGCLPDRTSVAGFRVRVFVARVQVPFELDLEVREVERALEVRVDHLRDEQRWEWRTVRFPPFERRLPFFDCGGADLWGLTARFTRELLERLAHAQS